MKERGQAVAAQGQAVAAQGQVVGGQVLVVQERVVAALVVAALVVADEVYEVASCRADLPHHNTVSDSQKTNSTDNLLSQVSHNRVSATMYPHIQAPVHKRLL